MYMLDTLKISYPTIVLKHLQLVLPPTKDYVLDSHLPGHVHQLAHQIYLIPAAILR